MLPGGTQARREPEILRYLEGATGPWLECPGRHLGLRKVLGAQDSGAGGGCWQNGGAGVWVHSEERLEYERGEREKAMLKVQEELEALRG
jgi:hypothetical protein